VAITKELMASAIDSNDVNCTEDSCPHGEALTTDLCKPLVIKDLLFCAGQPNPLLSAYAIGIHTGYRLHQLEEQQVAPVDTSKLN